MKEINDQQFKEITNQGLVLVDFWAPWCGPCKMQAPILEALAAEMKEKVSIFKMNVDENPVIPAEFGVMSIPTLLIKQNGRVVDKLVGLHDKDALVKILNEFM
ncbi:thioredoxin [Enterococcus lactis]|uniref:thioredoxin n=1 Tax=Enterococcus TaxID=1350 RepID=UPI0019F930FC|nr:MULTISPECIES: thioredoxin [Enterococcus]MDB7105048.1 thioredoxin [Enterococcus faecium]MDB7249756.1 thioredoxin [Enterococcus faecium]MDB7259798.1 thioredoxin [Enterococcus faecium]MDB7279006.1 thioredoxin [Enterococcus faecium]MDG4617621.1 thioredoxin [Enterococcus lactis]